MCVPVEAALYLRHNGVLWPIDYFFRHRGPCLKYQVEGTFAISPFFREVSVSIRLVLL